MTGVAYIHKLTKKLSSSCKSRYFVVILENRIPNPKANPANITTNIGNNSASGRVKKNQDSDWGMGSLFGSSLSDELQKLDIMTMTPIEALNELYRLQQQAREEAGQG